MARYNQDHMYYGVMVETHTIFPHVLSKNYTKQKFKLTRVMTKDSNYSPRRRSQ